MKVKVINVKKNIEDEKLYIKYYPNLTKGVVELAHKILTNDFFTNYTFILNKIKVYEWEQKEPEKINKKINEKINEIFNKMNSNENTKNIFENYFSYYNNIDILKN